MKDQTQKTKELNKHVWPLFLARAQDGLSMSNIEYKANNPKIARPLVATTTELRETNTATMNINQNKKKADISL
jgi:hypothetical protein